MTGGTAVSPVFRTKDISTHVPPVPSRYTLAVDAVDAAEMTELSMIRIFVAGPI